MNKNDQDVIAIAGYWEPLAHYRRGGWWVADDEENYRFNHSEQLVEQLKALAVTTVIWPGYKGLGMNFERAAWEQLKPFRALLERAGIEFGAYLQCGSYWAESFYRENPQAREWTALDYWGKPQPYSEYGRCYWRHRPCLTHREFSDYVGNVAATLVREYGATFFYADNNAQMPCYTPRFEKAFHDFLKEKYAAHTPEGLQRFVRRYGHPYVDDVVLPCGSGRRPIDAMPGLTDPGIQDWVEFRCRLVVRNAQIISAAAKAANPKTRLCFNVSYDQGEFNQLVWGTEPEFFAGVADHIMSEDGNSPRVESDGRLISHVHTCKHLRAMGRRGHFHAPSAHGFMSNDAAVLSLMEQAVHNRACLGPIYEFGAFEVRDGDKRPPTIRFIREREKLFVDNDSVAEIAVLRGRHANTINWLESFQGMLLAQQALFQAGFQWDNVIEANLDTLSKYRLLVLPETISVPEACVKTIAEYVRNGGRVLAVGESLSRNEWGRRRSPVRDDHPLASQSMERSVAGGNPYTSKQGDYRASIVCAWLGLEANHAGRVFVFSRLQHPHPLRWEIDRPSVPMVDSNYHARPLNGDAFIDCVSRALNAPPMVEKITELRNPYVIPTLLRARSDGRLSLHVLNYRSGARIESLRLRLRLPELLASRGGRLVGLESGDGGPIGLTREADAVTLDLPPFRQYVGVEFEAASHRDALQL